MPSYDFVCDNDVCNHKFETMQGIKEDPLKLCPACNKETLRRLIGAGGGLLFLGKGFHCTDYPKIPLSEPRDI